jgi:RNA polymerase sigma-70 factor, ECF subfamily
VHQKPAAEVAAAWLEVRRKSRLARIFWAAADFCGGELVEPTVRLRMKVPSTRTPTNNSLCAAKSSPEETVRRAEQTRGKTSSAGRILCGLASGHDLSRVDRLAQSLHRETAAGAEDPSLRKDASADAQPSAPVPLAELYDSYAEFVYRSLVGLGIAPARAEDAMQEVFIIANQHLATFEGTFYKAWLFRIAHSVARNVRRAVRRIEAEPLEVAQLVDRGASPFEHAVQAEEIRVLNQLLDQLKDRQREVFVLAELEQMAQTEIAEALGIHVNTVANRLTAARSNLERLLRKRQRGLHSGKVG